MSIKGSFDPVFERVRWMRFDRPHHPADRKGGARAQRSTALFGLAQAAFSARA